VPISRKQFNAGLTDDMVSFMKLTHGFLSAHRESAYQENEILQEVGPQLRSEPIRFVVGSPGGGHDTRGIAVNVPYSFTRDDLKPFRAALRKLVELNAVRAKLAGGVRHYTYNQDLADLE
jgi:hypothetical protein